MQSIAVLGSDTVPDIRSVSELLEVVVLLFSCSADLEVCAIVTRILSTFCDEARLITETSPDSAKSTLTILKNLDVYQEMSSGNFRFTGLVAFQKIFRKRLLTRLTEPTAGILTAWETVFSKWILLSKQLASSRPMEERPLVEWRNYSGFLASLGGCCIAEQASNAADDSVAGLRWIDRHAPEGSREDTLLDMYLAQSIRLLTCGNVRVREATRESLAEISPQLYFQLFRALQDELEDLFDGPRMGGPANMDPRIVFAEQAAALLKNIVERLVNPAEVGAALPIDIGELTLNFARFLDFADSKESLLVKIKVCQLCEVVTRKKELLNLRHDVRIRNALLENLFGWITRPGSSAGDSTGLINNGRADEILRLQKDLDKACLRALAFLTFRLPLQPVAAENDPDTGDLKAQMFHTYFNRFLSLLSYDAPDHGKKDLQQVVLNRDDTMTMADLAITALSNLLSANIDIGLKHSLGIGYHEDLEIRTAFVKVLCNVLLQGTEFNTLSDAAVSEKYDELLEVSTCMSISLLLVLTNF
jgi:neurofibromin 1